MGWVSYASMVMCLAMDADPFQGNQAIGSWVREVQGYGVVDRYWDACIDGWSCAGYTSHGCTSKSLLGYLRVGWWWVLRGF